MTGPLFTTEKENFHALPCAYFHDICRWADPPRTQILFSHARSGSFTTEADEATPRSMSASPRKRINSRRLSYVRFVPQATFCAAADGVFIRSPRWIPKCSGSNLPTKPFARCVFAFRRISRIDVRVLPIQIEHHWQDIAASTPPLPCADCLAVTKAQD
jgi:hypothetical protein